MNTFFDLDIEDMRFGGSPVGARRDEAAQIIRHHQVALSSLRPEGLKFRDLDDVDKLLVQFKADLAASGFVIRRSSFTQSDDLPRL